MGHDTWKPRPHRSRRTRRAVVIAGLVATMSVGVVAAPPAGAAPALPRSMAAIGDSITQAFDVCCYYGDHPDQSWSTGGAGWDPVRSHYERLRAARPAIEGLAFNQAVSGARMSSAPAQAAAAVAQRADYVTILLGANDLCTSSSATMTSVSSFRASFTTAMQTLREGIPSAKVFVGSIPDVYHLWEILRTNWLAQTVWDLAGICPSMLSSSNTEEQRQLVAQRQREFNAVLAEVCEQFRNCRHDDGAVYEYRFSPSQVSVLDFFHPSLSGQAALAEVTWAVSWWPTV